MEKIKAVLSGHSSHDADQTSSAKDSDDVNTPTSKATDSSVTEGHTNLSKLGGHQHRKDEIGADHTQGRHDPEVDAKEATSAAGNFPYWGDLPKESEHGSHSGGTLQNDSGLAAGGGAGLATGAAAAAAAASSSAGHRASEYEHRPLGSQGTTTATHEGLPDRAREAVQTSSAQGTSTTHPIQEESRRGEIAAATSGIGAAGAAAGATYIGTRHHDDKEDPSKPARAPGAATGPTSAGPGTLDPGYASQTSPVPGANQTFTSTSGPSNAPRQDVHSHRKEEAALGAGAGAAGLGYLAHHDETKETITPNTGGPIHNTVVGAGSDEDSSHAHQRTHKSSFDPSLLSSANTAGPQTGAVNPREQSTISSALGSAPRSDDDRDKQGLAAAAAGAGAGAGVVAVEEKHRHSHHHDERRQHRDEKPKKEGHSLFGSSSHKDDDKSKAHHHDKHAAQPTHQSAQMAAQQAWNKQNQAPASTSALYDAEPQSTTSSTTAGRSHHDSAVGPGAGIGGLAGAGAAAAYYGQGKEHDQNPRSAESDKIAERALGPDGVAQAPSSSSAAAAGQGRSFPLTGSNVGGASTGLSNPGQDSSRIVHKCHQCGADNDISDYFKKDSTFRMGS
ncbi:unnamed protein product [Discula destructiva]